PALMRFLGSSRLLSSQRVEARIEALFRSFDRLVATTLLHLPESRKGVRHEKHVSENLLFRARPRSARGRSVGLRRRVLLTNCSEERARAADSHADARLLNAVNSRPVVRLLKGTPGAGCPPRIELGRVPSLRRISSASSNPDEDANSR